MSVFMSVADGQGAGVVNSLCSIMCFFFWRDSDDFFYEGRKTKNGDVVCKRRWSYPCTFLLYKISFFSILLLTSGCS